MCKATFVSSFFFTKLDSPGEVSVLMTNRGKNFVTSLSIIGAFFFSINNFRVDFTHASQERGKTSKSGYQVYSTSFFDFFLLFCVVYENGVRTKIRFCHAKST
jgi:hypothetical protein